MNDLPLDAATGGNGPAAATGAETGTETGTETVATPPGAGAAAVSTEPERRSRMERIKASSEQAKVRAAQAREQLEGKRESNRLVDALLGGVERDELAGGGLLAGAIAFRCFFVLIPMVFVFVFGFGLGSEISESSAQDLVERAGITGLAAQAVQASTDVSLLSRIVTLGIALYALLSGGRNLVKALRGTHALVWGVRLQKLRQPTKAGVACVGVLVATVLLGHGIEQLRDASLIGWLVGLILLTGVAGGAWLLLCLRVFPRPDEVSWTDLVPGAVLFGGGLQVLHLVTVLWIARSIESKSETYGAIGAALTLLLWAYMLGRLVVASAALNAHIWHRAHPDDAPQGVLRS